MEQKQINSNRTLNHGRSLVWLTFILFAGIITLNSCGGKGGTEALSKKDSLAIAETIIIQDPQDIKGKFPRIYSLKFSADIQSRVFAENNDVKQVFYQWHEYSDKIYGLDAYGMDESGTRRLTGPYELEIITDIAPLSLIWADKSEYLKSTRGQLKQLQIPERVGRNEIIRTGEFKDLYFAPVDAACCENSNNMYFTIGTELKPLAGNPKIVVGRQQGYTNPVPPFTAICIECDSER